MTGMALLSNQGMASMGNNSKDTTHLPDKETIKPSFHAGHLSSNHGFGLMRPGAGMDSL
ncbi:MAG: hypothetical protein H7839_07060 [Magnetococcus sp. YQC-5]